MRMRPGEHRRHREGGRASLFESVERREQTRQLAMKKQTGHTLLEVVVAMVLLSVVVGGVIAAPHVSQGSSPNAALLANAQALADAQMEYVSACAYDDVNDPPQYGLNPDLPLNEPPYDGNYQVSTNAVRVDVSGNGTDDDEGIQRVTVAVSAYGDLVLSLEDNKFKR